MLWLFTPLVVLSSSIQYNIIDMNGNEISQYQVVSSTCDYNDINHLLTIVNQSSSIRFQRALDDTYNLIGPKLNVAIISPFLDEEIRKNYSTYGFAINEYYARANGYLYIVNQTVADDDRYFNWNSISQIRNALQTWGKNMDYIVYTTFESVFTNFDFRIEQFMVKSKKTNVVFLAGGAMTGAKISSDFIIVRNNIWTMDFLDDLWTTREHNQFSEIQVFEELYKLYEEDLKDHIMIISNNVFRNDYPAMSKYRSNHHMLSFPLEVAEYKRNVYEEIFEMLCSFERKAQPFGVNVNLLSYPLQRSVTREMLKMHSVETYRAIWDDKMAEYSAKAIRGENTPTDTDRLSTITVYLSNTISLFDPEYEAVPVSNDSLEPIDGELTEAHNESIKILSKTFKQMFINLKKYRSNLSDTPQKALEYMKLDPQYPNMLKAVLRLGQEYMSHLKKSPKELKILTEILRDILEDLVTINNKDVETQESLVYMNVDLGMDHMAHKRYQQALADFLSALRVARRVGNYIGDQIVLTPANQAAEAMVMLERYEEAVVLYDTVVPLTKKHNGAEDLTSAYIFIQAAFAYHQYQRHKTAHNLVEKAIEILEMNGVDRTDPKVYTHAKEIERSTRGKPDIDDEAANKDYGF